MWDTIIYLTDKVLIFNHEYILIIFAGKRDRSETSSDDDDDEDLIKRLDKVPVCFNLSYSMANLQQFSLAAVLRIWIRSNPKLFAGSGSLGNGTDMKRRIPAECDSGNII